MNEKNNYEKRLAEQLEQLPPPGTAGSHWPQMKSLLDKDLPEGGGRGPGFGRWWVYTLVGGLLLTTIWWATNRNVATETNQLAVVGENAQPAALPGNEVKSETKQLSKNNVSSAQENKIASATDAAPVENNASVAPASSNNSSNTATAAATSADNFAKEKSALKTTTENKTITKKDNPLAVNSSKATPPSFGIKKSDNKNNSRIEKKSTLPSSVKNSSAKKNPAVTASSNGVAANTLLPSKKKKTIQSLDKKVNSIVAADRIKSKKGSGKKNYPNNQQSLSDASLPDTHTERIQPTVVTAPLAVLSIPPGGLAATWSDSMITDYAYQVKALPTVLPAPTRFKKETERTRSLKNRVVGSGTDKQYAIGLSLPLAFPIGTQDGLAYNINAGSSALTDFLPVPHLQYHFSDKSYLQAEFQFIAPQYIQPVLLFQKKYEIAGSSSNYRFMTSSIYANKLYYFSLPVVAYYSPFRNFYLGTGLQYSKLLSGVGLYEDRIAASLQPGARDSLYRSVFRKFKKDSVSDKLAGHEFRFIFDANYYWHRFTVGMRYTQAVSDFVSIQLTNNTPLYTDRNKSLQFYLRYNIWEGMRPKKPALVAWR